MKRLIAYLTALVIGAMLGGGYVWISSHLDTNHNHKTLIRLEKIFEHANIEIKDENFSCVGDTTRTVGGVLGSIYDMNNQKLRNTAFLWCVETTKTCSLSINYCKPWQLSECGSRHLKFEFNANSEIIPETFTCVDAP